jgi:hypothetical protein
MLRLARLARMERVLHSLGLVDVTARRVVVLVLELVLLVVLLMEELLVVLSSLIVLRRMLGALYLVAPVG